MGSQTTRSRTVVKTYGRPTRQERRLAGNDQDKDVPEAAAVAAEMAQDSESDEGTDLVCMMANEGISPQSASSNRRSTLRHIDSAATSHMTFDRSAFATYSPVTPFHVRVGDSSTSLAVGRGDRTPEHSEQREVREVQALRCASRPLIVYSLISVTTVAKRG